MSERLNALAEAGVSIWLDDLSRERIESGGLADLVKEKHVVGVTTNPTIFAAALANGQVYDAQVRELAARGASVDDTVREVTVADVQQACDVFSGTWETTGGVDGRVSLEVSPLLARDTDATLAEAVDLWKAVDRPNLLVKIPATQEGLSAITSALAEGVSVNVTLIFSVERYRDVMTAYLEGLERAAANGQNLGNIASVASFFVSRVDTEVDKRLDALDGHDDLKGKLAIANAKLAYRHWQETFAGPRWEFLASKGAKSQRCLWASTSTKNPDFRDVLYVEELIGSETVNTMPLETVQAFQDHGAVKPNSILDGVADAQKLVERLAEVGVDYDDVVTTLEAEGVQKFADSFQELLDGIRAKREQLAAA